MIALLGMYDPPALHAANDRFWQLIRAELGYGPDALTRDMGFMDAWQSPDLLFSQTCGLPYRSVLHPDVTLIGTPDNGLPGVAPGYYCSALVVHADAQGSALADFAGSRFAYNQTMSQSGWAGPMDHIDRAGVRFASFVETGGHAASALAVAEGRADMAGLDLLTWTLIGEHDPDLAARLRIIDTSAPTPTLPYITAKSRDPVPILAAVRAAIAGLSESDRAALHLYGLVDIPADDYLSVPTPPAPGSR
jgi:ABC-type phosphate/phosphonate transport system substrate-binding protein